MKIKLTDGMFTPREELFAEEGGLKAVLFRYESGICCVRLENSRGHISVLPFNGQMVWDAVMDGRSLKMKTTYDMPKPAALFRDTYGCYVMHCGILAMGCPCEQDTHAHHGELPYADYDRAYLETGEDGKGKYIAVTGEYEYNRAFDSHYIARPFAKLYEDSTLIDVGINVENLARGPMDVMYMCHVNGNVADHSKLYQTLPWDSDHMVVRVSIPQYNEPDPVFLKLLDDVQNDVKVTRAIGLADQYDPEIVLFLRDVMADEHGMAHFVYEHRDGTSDYVTYDAGVLDKAVRWMVNHKDWRSMGFVLPSTAEPEGYIAEKAKGNVRSLPGGETFSAQVTCGCLDARQTAQVKDKIKSILGKEWID